VLWTPPDVETKVHEVPARLAEPYNFVGNPQRLREAPLSLACVELCLAPDRLIVIGRANGHRVPYLDPAYQATTIVPDSGQCVLRGNFWEEDILVSRAHFTLRAAVGGIMFTNGVPRRGGGIRPPVNRTYLIAPVRRLLMPGEEVLIACGSSIAAELPNRCVLRLGAR
jgi:hypothetical protein